MMITSTTSAISSDRFSGPMNCVTARSGWFGVRGGAICPAVPCSDMLAIAAPFLPTPFRRPAPVPAEESPLRWPWIFRSAPRGAAVHHHDPVGQRQELRHLRRDQHDRHTVTRQLIDQAIDLGLGADVDGARRLV